ncbi:hypothetical protein [Ekhidna sp.]|uniref:hypothetical protein n=1 Tax=Ekhidna sp. TaxID=2608089 RepID=UPI003CCC2BDC
MKNQIELTTGKHWLCEKGMLCSEFWIPEGRFMVDSRMILDHIESAVTVLSGNRLPFLNDMTSSEGILSFDALKKWGQSELLNEYRVAEAYIVKSLSDLIFIKQHIRLNDLKFPAMVFQSVERAKEWLSQVKEDTTPSSFKNTKTQSKSERL